jgi:hypothetical protein
MGAATSKRNPKPSRIHVTISRAERGCNAHEYPASLVAIAESWQRALAGRRVKSVGALAIAKKVSEHLIATPGRGALGEQS